MSLKTRYNFTVKKFAVNNENSSKSTGVKRALFGKADDNNASPEKRRISSENETSPSKISPSKSPVLVKAKQAFHTGVPSRLVGRSKEIGEVRSFLFDHLSNNSGGSLYISGAPGTGKTSSLMFVVKNMEKKFKFVFVNCMSVSSPGQIYKTIGKELGLSAKSLNSKNLPDLLRKHFTSSETITLLVLDEIDQLDSKGQQVLYSIFEWPHLPGSSLILIGIANALDLTDRLLPRLHTFKYQPKLMHFQPYTKDEIVSILEDRLSEAKSPVIKPIALQLCARKIAANTGDIRKALDVCRRAIEIVENKPQTSPLKATADDRCNPGSPMKPVSLPPFVDLQEISTVLHEVYGSRLQTSNISANKSSSNTVTMPLQHTLLLCTLVLIRKFCNKIDLSTGKAYDVFRRVCAKRNISISGECEFRSLCKLMESRGFIQLKENKVARLTKIDLKVDEKEAEHVLQDKAILATILADKSVLSN